MTTGPPADLFVHWGFPFTWRQFERYWYLFSIGVILASMPFSKLGLSIGQLMILGGWIVERMAIREGTLRWLALPTGRRAALFLPLFLWYVARAILAGLKQFAANRAALVFTSIFALHLAGLLYTTDFSYAFKDLRTKLPILLLPVVFSTSEAFGRKAFYRFMLIFLAAVAVRSLFNAWLIAGHRYADIRDVSQNVSHIVFGLLLALGVYVLVFFILKRGWFRPWQRALFLVALAWLAAYLVISQSFTGVAVAVLTLLVLIPLLVLRTHRKRLRNILIAGFLAVNAALGFYLVNIVRDFYRVNPVDYKTVEMTTSRGNPYNHDYYNLEAENGNLLWLYVQWDELREAWNRRSDIPFDSLNRRGEPMHYTVVRFLNSKGWRKDADAVERLTPAEIAAVERGVANYLFLDRFSIRGRIYEFLWGFEHYRKTGNPSGSSVMQRIEFWRASAGIIRDHWLTGVGTGDMNLAFSEQYEKMNTQLEPGQRWRSHNQFLSILVGFGIFGLAWFLWAILWPARMLRRGNDYFFTVFIIILFLSMLTGDTIETQTGVSFFAVFYTLFLFARGERDDILPAENQT